MRRLPHLVWFDARALRVPLAAWAMLLLVDGTLFYLGPFAGVDLPELGRVSVTFGLAAARWVVSVVIVARLVHADPTVGTTAFWRSRPISWLVLLASKLTSVLLWLVVLPGIVTTAVLCLLGMDLAAASIGGANASCEQAVIVCMALALAIVTKDLVQFIVGVVVGIGMLVIVDRALLPTVFSMWPGLETVLPYGSRLASTTAVISLVGFAALYQYLTLRVRQSTAMLACAMILGSVTLAVGSGTSRWTRQWPGPVPAGLIGPSDVALSAVADTQRGYASLNGMNARGTPTHVVSVEVATSGVPAGLSFTPLELTSGLEFPDHTVATWTRRWPAAPAWPDTRVRATVEDEPYRSIRQALGNTDLYIGPTIMRVASRWAVAGIPTEQFQRYRRQPSRLDANITLLAYRYKVDAATPIAAGNTLWLSSGGVASIESVTRTSKEVTVVLRTTYVLNASRRWALTPGARFVLRNAKRGLALLYHQTGFRYLSYGMYFWTSPVESSVSELHFDLPDRSAGGALVDDEWIKTGELVSIAPEELGTITRPLRIDRFVIGANGSKESLDGRGP